MGFLDRFFGGVPDEKSFATLVIEHMKKSGEARPITFEPQRFQLVVGDPGGAVNILFLGNAYEEFKALPKKDRNRVFQRYAPEEYTNVDAFDDKGAAARSLLPRIRDRLYASTLGLRTRQQFGDQLLKGSDTLPTLPHRPVGDVLAASLCIDLPTTVIDCLDQNYTRWKSSIDELWPVALENLRSISKKPFKQVAPGVFVSPYSDSHDPARLLLPELFVNLPIKGAPVAGVPNRNTLIVTGADDAAGLDEFVTLMKMGLKDPRTVSSMPLILTDAGWAPFERTRTDSVGKELSILAAQSRLSLNDGQKETLEAEHQRIGRDVFVASYKAVMSKAGEVISYSTWTKDVETLLPKTRDLMFVVLLDESPENPEVIRVPWEVAVRVVGHRMKQEAGVWPERWLVESFPSEAELTALRVAAT
ncbi:MAG: hypothetical protein Q8L14_38345 [Myxococcales bacterium]|nr:hypothetical protein [Myxococcales bacterium]